MKKNTNCKTTTCYIGIGSNLGKPLQQVTQAMRAISQTGGITLRRCSPWYSSEAVGPGDQENYINGVLEIETTLTPQALLTALQAIENHQGRTRGVRWGPRTLDLDILLYGNLHLDTPDLQLPHPRIRERLFVLTPLADLSPALILDADPNRPKDSKNETIAALLARLPQDGLWPAEGESAPKTI